MTDLFSFPGDGQTPLDPDEMVGLKPTWVATRSDLNEAEAANIAQARHRWLARPPAPDQLLDDLTLRRLHRDMFGDVWDWAGTYRATDRNIGLDPRQVSRSVRNLCDNARLWIDPDCSSDDLARFHHQLVAIHPFPNGNGRHARLATDLLAATTGHPPPTWGGDLKDIAALRAGYLDALRAADRDPEDLGRLVDFMW